MHHSITALWTIPNFEFWEFLPVFAVKFKDIYFHFQTVQTLLRGLGALWSGFELFGKYNVDSLQRAIRLKGLIQV